jgi:hypothetical protein
MIPAGPSRFPCIYPAYPGLPRATVGPATEPALNPDSGRWAESTRGRRSFLDYQPSESFPVHQVKGGVAMSADGVGADTGEDHPRYLPGGHAVGAPRRPVTARTSSMSPSTAPVTNARGAKATASRGSTGSANLRPAIWCRYPALPGRSGLVPLRKDMTSACPLLPPPATGPARRSSISATRARGSSALESAVVTSTSTTVTAAPTASSSRAASSSGTPP